MTMGHWCITGLPSKPRFVGAKIRRITSLEFLSNNFISDFFLLVLKWVYSIIGEYSVAIIVVTIAMRLIMLPLDLKQKKSTRKMSTIQPQVESLKKRYANNPQQLQKKTQELYRKEGVRPLAGCLPMLITLPIFFAFFGAMRVLAAQETVSFMLDNAQLYSQGVQQTALPQWLWVHNFWQADSGLTPILPTSVEFVSFVQTNATYITPQAMHMLAHAAPDVSLLNFNYATGVLSTDMTQYEAIVTKIIGDNGVTGYNNGWFILPVFAGITLFLQQKLTMGQTPQAAGQGKFMLWFFPLFSVYICAISNAAFAIYWVFANLYALGQALVLNYIYKKQDDKAKGIIEEAP
jgi:YidC/Oxa1 family membrane protein insertase